MEAIAVQGLIYQYYSGSPQVLKGIDFSVQPGEIVVVAGLSGCGKSTLCHCISGIIRHNRDGVMAGNILVNGKNIEEINGASLALEVGMVFQDPDTQLFSPTVEDEIAFAPENMCLPPERILERVSNALEVLGISDLRYANPYHLSGGEKHLVALAAVLALDPPVLILDEVMSQLDIVGKQRVGDALTRLRDSGKTIIAVEHDLQAVAFSDRLAVLDDGKIICFEPTSALLAEPSFLAAHGLIDVEYNGV